MSLLSNRKTIATRKFKRAFSGGFSEDPVTRKIYSTDASVYQEMPIAVAFPKTEHDIFLLIELAIATGNSLIPRTAGTSLAGQVVGSGIIVDVSRHFNEIVEINPIDRWVRVQPGVIRNELNMALRPHRLFFGPETSTSNRAMIGGMLGNNACGANSIVYGSTRDKTLIVRGFLADGSLVTFRETSPAELTEICSRQSDDLETRIYRGLDKMLRDPLNRSEIEKQFPAPQVTRRNTGYPLDLLMKTRPFGDFDNPFNLCHLIAGSEGTLFFATEITLQCDDLPPKYAAVLCAHFRSIDESLRANIVAMKFNPTASELIDRFVLEGARRNIALQQATSLIVGDPTALLMIELRDHSEQDLARRIEEMRRELNKYSLGFEHPVAFGDDAKQVWELRRAGLGVVANIPGDNKPVTVIEDTAVSIHLLPSYIKELNLMLKSEFNVDCVHYGHAGSGELHLRPVLDLKTESGRETFRRIAMKVTKLVKKFGGSLSGEHGDGRLRSEFIAEMIGPHNTELLRRVKQLFDPCNRFNPGKIVDSPPMDHQLRGCNQSEHQPATVFDFSDTISLLGAVEMCSGSGDCRKTELSGGTMCPSYMATRAEQDTTRARANILRHALTDSSQLKPLGSDEVKQVMDLCLSCKGCKNECPSNVDIAKIKAEFLQGYHDAHGTPLRSRLIAGIDRINRLNSVWPPLYNFMATNRFCSSMVKRLCGFHVRRSLPTLYRTTLRSWFRRHTPHRNAGAHGEIFLFADEFTNYYDVPVGIAAIELFERLGFAVTIPKHLESGRASISKGLLLKAQKIAVRNVKWLTSQIPKNGVLVGLEPSAILTFRDEYLNLVPRTLRDSTHELASRCLMFDEFLDTQIQHGTINSTPFTKQPQTIRIHGHCHQKALGSLASSVRILQLPQNYQVKLIPAGCCGMAGSFGFEREHYDVSMRIGELVLFPRIREEPNTTLIAAAGTSCRHQILDGTARLAQHPVQILFDALQSPENH